MLITANNAHRGDRFRKEIVGAGLKPTPAVRRMDRPGSKPAPTEDSTDRHAISEIPRGFKTCPHGDHTSYNPFLFHIIKAAHR